MWLPKVVRSPGCDPGRHKEFRNGPAVKIDILDEGYWSPEVFRGYQAMASMTERREPRQVLEGLMGQRGRGKPSH